MDSNAWANFRHFNSPLLDVLVCISLDRCWFVNEKYRLIQQVSMCHWGNPTHVVCLSCCRNKHVLAIGDLLAQNPGVPTLSTVTHSSVKGLFLSENGSSGIPWEVKLLNIQRSIEKIIFLRVLNWVLFWNSLYIKANVNLKCLYNQHYLIKQYLLDILMFRMNTFLILVLLMDPGIITGTLGANLKYISLICWPRNSIYPHRPLY